LTAIAVHLSGISKRFGAVAANSDVELRVAAGTVHALVGENGAGKSTLMSVLYGLYRADAGTISIAGEVVDIRNADDAIAVGIGMVHQHFMLVDTLTALDNVMLGAEPHWSLGRAQSIVRKELIALMEATGLQVPLDAQVLSVSMGERQRLEILKALYRGAKILILDEPTAVLTPQETQTLFEVLRKLKSRGTTILLITHKLHEVMALCDAVTVMRGGCVVADLPVAQASVEGLALAMVGRKVNMGPVTHTQTGASDKTLLLQTSDLNLRDSMNVSRLVSINLDLYAGEIVGVAGVSGNGQSELLEVLSGMQKPQKGRLTLSRQLFDSAQWLDPVKARALGLAHVPEDRHGRGLVMDFVAWESAVLGYEALPHYRSGVWMNHAAMRKATADFLERFDVRPRDPELKSHKFSGGNQQKLVLARELGQSPKVLLVGQPTRGVDIGAIEFIYGQLRAMRDAGCAVLLVSSELDEILALADRVVVMNLGRITGTLDIAQCTQEKLGLMMAGGTP
jgi:simple sugar transport system ATP-binding protein